MEFETLRLEFADGIARLTFIQPERGNPIDGPSCAEICEAAIILSDRKDVRAVLISAQGKAFSYGGDIKAFLPQLDQLPHLIKRWTADLHSGIARLQRMDAPIVAAVHGVCAGGMAGFVAGADIVIVEPDTKFVAAFPGIGFSNDSGSSVMFARRMGLQRARRYLLLNQTIGAADAVACCLADELVPLDQLHARAEAVAANLARGPTLAFGEIRRLMLNAAHQPLETQMEMEAQSLSRIAGTADAREGITAFAEKRKAKFTGA